MRALLALLALTAAPALAQTAVVWERVGTEPVGAKRPSLGPDGTLWATGWDGLYALAPPYGPTEPWALRADLVFDAVLALGPDTLVATTNIGLARSVDGGASFQTAATDGAGRAAVLAEIPFGLPHGGALVGGPQLGSQWATSSRDRGASWRLASIPNSDQQSPSAEALAVVRTGPHAGRVVGAGAWGLAVSDDGGASFAPVPGWWQYFRFSAQAVAVLEGAAPGGGDRLVATTVDPQHVPDTECIVLVSDDGGDTWRETFDLTGDPNAASAAVVDFGGGRAVIVMNGGHVWESTDAGETWARLDTVVPGALVDPAGSPTFARVFWALRGPDGRLYVGGLRLGGVNPGWTYRTAATFVAGEASPEGPDALGLSVRPNPAGGRVEVVVTLAAAGPVRVVVLDALGREVAVVLDGEAPSGERAVSVDTSRWPAGVYVVRATAGTHVATARLTVVR